MCDGSFWIWAFALLNYYVNRNLALYSMPVVAVTPRERNK